MPTVTQPRTEADAELLALAGELRAVIGRLTRRLRDEGSVGDLTWSQIKVLTRLDRDGPQTVTTLAQAEGVRPQSMGATVAALREAGLVVGTPDPSDGRQTVLSLSEECRRALAAHRAAKQDWLYRAMQTRLSAAEQKQLADGIRLLGRLVES